MNRYVIGGIVAVVGCSSAQVNTSIEPGSIEHYDADVQGYTSWLEQEAERRSMQTRQIVERAKSEDLQPGDALYSDRKNNLLEAKGDIDSLYFQADGAADVLKTRLMLRRVAPDKEKLTQKEIVSLRKRLKAVSERYQENAGSLSDAGREYFMKEFKDIPKD